MEAETVFLFFTTSGNYVQQHNDDTLSGYESGNHDFASADTGCYIQGVQILNTNLFHLFLSKGVDYVPA